MPERGCPLRYGAESLSTPFSPSSTISSLTFMGIFQLLSVHPLTSDSLDLDKEERFLGGCKGQTELMVLQGVKGGLGASKGGWAGH